MPVVAQFELQRQQYEHFKEMERMVKERHGEDSGSSSYVSRPWFDHQVMNDFTVELTIEHPYWSGVRRYECNGPRFDRDYPHVEDFLNDYYKQTDNLHTLASHLMHFIDPDAPEIRVMPDAPADTARAMPAVDAADEIRKYKELLDSGAITAEEFAAKKKQLLGI